MNKTIRLRSLIKSKMKFVSKVLKIDDNYPWMQYINGIKVMIAAKPESKNNIQ